MSQPPKSGGIVGMLFPLTKWVRFGDYPAAYDPAIHGPYNPSQYYGKPDTPFGELKPRELSAWLSRRNMGPRGLAGIISRAYWRWQLAWIHPKKVTAAPFYQIVVTTCIFFYTINYLRIRGHRHYKYH